MAKTLQERLVVRIAAPLRDELEAAAERDSRPLSGLVRLALQQWLERRAAVDQPAARGRQ